MNRHLVAVEVRVERGANERMDADRFTFDEHRLERLNAETVQRGSAIEQYGMLANHVLEDVPDDRFLGFDEFLRLLDRGAVAGGFELVIDERLEKLERHLLRQTALVEFQFRADDDDGTAGIVHALAEKVLAEAALLALERVGERLERAIVGSAQDAAAAAVVEERVNSFLQHALFVANDYVGRVQLHQLLQPVVAVDDAAIEVVQVGRGETAAIERHKRAQLRRKNRNHVENHPLGLVAALAECFENFQALRELDPLLQARIDFHFFAELFGELVDFDAAQEFLDRFRAHPGLEFSGIFLLQLAEFFLGQDFLFLQARDFAWIDADERLEVKDVLEVAHGDVEQVADAAGQALEEPHVRAGRSEFDMAEALAADFAERDFDAALVADHAAMLHPLVFSAQAFPVGDGAENLGAEQAVALRLEGAVIDGFRLGDFAVRPRTDFFRTRQADANRIEIRNLAGAIVRARSIQWLTLLPDNCQGKIQKQETSGRSRVHRGCDAQREREN